MSSLMTGSASRDSMPGHTAVSLQHVVEIKPRTSWLDLDFNGVWQYRELLWFLVMRDLKVRYKQAALGIGWAVIQPVFAVLIFTMVFGVFAKIPSEGIPYPLFAFAAMLPWTLFSESTRRCALGLVGDAALLGKIYFPRLIIPVSNVLTPAVDFVVALVVFLGVMAFYGIAPTANILFLPVLVLLTALLGLSVGLWLGPINVRHRDVTHTLPFLLQIWMYATPIVYPLSMIPEQWQGLYSINPMVGLIEAYRWALLGHGQLNLNAVAVGAVVTIIVLVGGLIFFRRAERQFADII